MYGLKHILIASIIIIIMHQNFRVVNCNKFMRVPESVKNFFGNFADNRRDPCSNFYDYACGNYAKENPNPNYSEITQNLDYDMNNKLIKALSETANYISYDNERQNYSDKMHLYFESCHRQRQRNITKYLDEIKPATKLNWPLLESDKEGEEDWLGKHQSFDYWALLGEMQSYGLNNVIVQQEITRNRDNSLSITLTPATIPAEGSLPEDIILQNLLNMLQLNDSDFIIQQLNSTDLKWLNMTQLSEDVSVEVKKITLADVKTLYPDLNSYLEHLLSSKDLENLSVITLQNPQYFEFLNEKSWTKLELQQLCNYLMVKFLYYLAVDSTADFTLLKCVKDLRNKYDLAVNFYYYQHFFRKEEYKFIAAVNYVERRLKKSMSKYFHKNRLQLSPEQIHYLKDKLKAIEINKGNLPKNCKRHSIENFYRDVPFMDKENYYKNHMLLLKHRFHLTLLYQQNHTHYVVTDNNMGSVSSPFYVPQQNMIIIPFGSFQRPFFHYNQILQEKLALLGFVLAHELAHAFDTTGLLFDKRGLPSDLGLHILNNTIFLQSLNCLQNQQSADNTDYIDERIADLFAVHVAYDAFLDTFWSFWNASKREFFIKLAQFFCGKNDVTFIDHDSDTVRLQQILNNFSPFAWAFGCSKNCAMNSKTKCQLY